MKVAHLGMGIIPVPPGDIAAGVEEYIYQLTRHLGQLGCHVHVIDIKGGAQQKEKRRESPVKFHEVWRLALPSHYTFPFIPRFINYIILMSHVLLFSTLSFFVLNRLMAREKIDIIHTHNRESALAAIMASKLHRNGAVIVYTPQAAYGLTKLSRRKKLINFAEIPALKLVDHIIAFTPAVKGWLVSEFNLDSTKITPIPVGTALDEIEQFLSHKTSTSHQSNIVLFAGSVSTRKNQLSAVKAIPQVIIKHPEIKFVFTGPVGDAKYFSLIQSFIAENNLSSHTEFRGVVTKQELYNLYSEARIFLFPTTAEVQPTVLMEALAFGLPIITSTIAPITDVVGQVEGSAILVDPHDMDGIAAATIRLLDNNSLQQSMSQQAKKLARSLSYEHVATQTLNLYSELVKKRLTGK